MTFHKYHALGNDYIVLNPEEFKEELTPEKIQRICHRNFGIGSDGILFGPLETEKAQFGLQIFNPDGSEAEKSGNGLRIFSRYLFDSGKVGEEAFTIQTLGGEVTSEIQDRGKRVSVEMGRVSFQSDEIPVSGASREVLEESFIVDGEELVFSAATIGNPHCVVVRSDISPEDAHRFGPLIEVDKRFPNRTNVQFLKVLDRSNIQIEIWERGAGYTLASGSSSSASAAIAHKLGLIDPEVTVHMPGGEIEISIRGDYDILMQGGVTRVAEGNIFPEMLHTACT